MVRGSANPITEEIKECAALQAQYIYDTYGKFPATIPSIFLLTYLQAQHIDLDFYDHFFNPGAYLSTHKNHMRKWHNNSSHLQLIDHITHIDYGNTIASISAGISLL